VLILKCRLKKARRRRLRTNIFTSDVGEDTGTPVNLDYDVPFAFTGQIEKVVISLGEPKLSDADQKTVKNMEKMTKDRAE
jgi:hypothetical protein